MRLSGSGWMQISAAGEQSLAGPETWKLDNGHNKGP
jgi:hypothetical protein